MLGPCCVLRVILGEKFWLSSFRRRWGVKKTQKGSGFKKSLHSGKMKLGVMGYEVLSCSFGRRVSYIGSGNFRLL